MIGPNVRAIFFDAVGTLIEPVPDAVQVYHTAGVRRGISLDLPTIAERFRTAFRAEEQADEAADLAVDEQREHHRWQNIVRAVFGGGPIADELFAELWDYFAQPQVWQVLDSAAELLRQAQQQGLTLGLASNFDRRLHAIADALPELAAMPHRIISSEVGWRKPSPRFFDAVARAAGCERNAILFIGDRRDVDYDGARHAGLQAMLLEK